MDNDQTYSAECGLSLRPLITIITVVRNAAADLRNTIESVRRQSYKNIQYVVIDGASTDGTLELVQACPDVITKYVSGPDQGLYDAMNKGISYAEGDFVLFMNAGDIFVSYTVLERLLARIHRLDTVYFGVVLISYQHGSWATPPATLRGKALLYGYYPHHQSILYPKSYYKANNYDTSFRICADMDYTIRAMDSFPCSFVDVEMIVTKLGGLSNRVMSYAEAVTRYREHKRVLSKYSNKFSRAHFLALPVRFGLKYAIGLLGGYNLIYLAMRLSQRLRIALGIRL